MYIAIELLRDLAQRDPTAFHHFLWANHLAYAQGFDLTRFEPGNLEATRTQLLDMLCQELRAQGIEPSTDVRSVLDVGCSTGYLLRHAETVVFPSATTLAGIDIDERAVAMGSGYLEQAGSVITLTAGPMEQLDRAFAGQDFDVILCLGTLLYLDESEATETLASLLGHANRVVGLIGLAHPDRDNRTLERSTVRASDASWIHDFDGMVEAAGGSVRSRRWEPASDLNARGLYMLVATPGAVVEPPVVES
jgi:SAM-dependent methyltransferase